ncbi:MAG TPA: molybdate ABC transporter substrate-binding protein [archaeon]|nr:molybdate ABC transporter substrate-binding protein [archaeon]
MKSTTLEILFLKTLFAFLAFSALFWACGKGGTDKNLLTVYAAASLSDVLQEISPVFERESGLEAAFDFASSGSLAKKIAAGAPADIFLSADIKWIDFLEEGGYLEAASKRLIARNRLVCVVPAGAIYRISEPGDLRSLRLIGIGDPDHVPAGRYAKEALESCGLWDTLRGENRLVFAWNVRAVLSYVEEANAEAGIVYLTDAVLSDKVEIAFSFPRRSHAPIGYYAAAVSNSGKSKGVESFLALLSSERFQQILTRNGFLLPMDQQ